MITYAFVYRAFADRRGYLIIEFITDNNLAYVKPAVIRDKQHYVCSENTLILGYTFCW